MKINANRLINALEIRKKSQQTLSSLFGRTKRRKTIIDTLNAVIELINQLVKEEEQKAEHLPNYKIDIDLFDEEQIFDVVEEQPEFPGGMKVLAKYLSDNIHYPRISRDNYSQGRAFVQFTVNADGSIQDVEIIRSSGDIYLDKEAIRVVEAMPKWKPGKQQGKAVRVKFRLPVIFRLQ